MINIDHNEQEVYAALRTWLLTILPNDWEVVQGQENLVPMPIGNFVLMTSISYQRLSTNVSFLSNSGLTNNIKNQFQYKIQLDFYGASASEYSAAVSTMLRYPTTPDQFPAYFKPLYADDVKQIPLINAESNYEERWMMDATFQYNPTFSNTSQSANVLQGSVIPVDVIYK